MTTLTISEDLHHSVLLLMLNFRAYKITKGPSRMVSILLCIRLVPDFNLDPRTIYFVSGLACFSLGCPANAKLRGHKLRLLPSTFVPIHYLLFVLQFDDGL